MSNQIIVLLLICISIVNAQEQSNGYKIVTKLIDQCLRNEDVMKCFKIQAFKIANRALHSNAFSIIDGINVVRNNEMETGRNFAERTSYSEEKLELLDSNQIDGLIADRVSRFLETHTIQVNMPQLIEEGRGKSKKGNMHLLGLAMAIKGAFLAMSYKGIAVMAGTALLVGKMALVLSAILGLKKLISSGHEKTTFEIVKHPQHSESHKYTSSYEDEGHYHRSLSSGEDMLMQDRVYRAYIPQK